MPKITFIDHRSVEHTIDVACGSSVMQAATGNNIAGIDADCGGQCACATCQVFVAAEWVNRVGRPNMQEALMLEATVNASPNSRLSCQIVVTSDLDGLVVHLPESQH